jgi:hypothetical protein
MHDNFSFPDMDATDAFKDVQVLKKQWDDECQDADEQLVELRKKLATASQQLKEVEVIKTNKDKGIVPTKTQQAKVGREMHLRGMVTERLEDMMAVEDMIMDRLRSGLTHVKSYADQFKTDLKALEKIKAQTATNKITKTQQEKLRKEVQLQMEYDQLHDMASWIKMEIMTRQKSHLKMAELHRNELVNSNQMQFDAIAKAQEAQNRQLQFRAEELARSRADGVGQQEQQALANEAAERGRDEAKLSAERTERRSISWPLSSTSLLHSAFSL